MVKYNELGSILESTNIPCAEYHYEDFEEQTIAIPSLVYTIISNDDRSADGKAYIRFLNVRIELLTNTIGFEEQEKVEEALRDKDVYYSKSVEYDEDNRLFSTVYDITVLPDDSSK